VHHNPKNVWEGPCGGWDGVAKCTGLVRILLWTKTAMLLFIEIVVSVQLFRLGEGQAFRRLQPFVHVADCYAIKLLKPIDNV
jgi:hypothetical protein